MKKTYKIEVDCANCANKMEDAAKNTAGVQNATVNFMTQKMIVEFEEGQDAKSVMKDVLKNCKKVEDDCEIYLEEGEKNDEEAEEDADQDHCCGGAPDSIEFPSGNRNYQICIIFDSISDRWLRYFEESMEGNLKPSGI